MIQQVITQSKVEQLHRVIEQKDLAISALCDRISLLESELKEVNLHNKALESELMKLGNIHDYEFYNKRG